MNPERRSSGSQFYIVWGQTYNSGQMGQLSKQLQMQAEQQIFNSLVAKRRKEIMQLRRDRNQQALAELQDELIAQTEAIMAEQGPQGLSDLQKEAYSTVGGTPHLDGQYTVFGEVTDGLDVVEKIQNCKTAQGDRPDEDISMTVTIIEE